MKKQNAYLDFNSPDSTCALTINKIELLPNISKIKSIGSYGMYGAFSGCTNLSAIHYRYDMSSMISLASAAGAPNATVYYDVGTALLSETVNVSDYSISVNGVQSRLLLTNKLNTVFIEKSEYVSKLDEFFVQLSEENTTVHKSYTLSTTGGINYTVSVNSAYSDPTIVFSSNNSEFKRGNSGQTLSCLLENGISSINYKVTKIGFKLVSGTLTNAAPSVYISEMEEIRSASIGFEDGEPSP